MDDKKNALAWDRTRDLSVNSRTLCQLSQEGTTSAGFEPARDNPSRFRICRLNHSAKMPYYADYHFINKMKKILKKKNELKSKKINATHVGNHKTFIVSRISIVVSTSRCGRENPGSNPGYGRKHPWSSWL